MLTDRIKLNLKIIIFFITVCLGACKKQDAFLNEKADAKLTTIAVLSDVQKLLTNERIFNVNATPGLGATSSELYYVTDQDYLGRDFQDQRLYIWAKDIYPQGANVADWSQPYEQVFYANTALDALSEITVGSQDKLLADQLKGEALFYRSYAFFNLMQQFTEPYDSVKANNQLGIPLRLSANLNEPVRRSSQKNCYDQILTDLKTAGSLLPDQTSRITAPAKAAADAMLARVYLCLGKFGEALEYSNKALQLKGQLFDYNEVVPGGLPAFADGVTPYPVPEVIYFSTMTGGLFANFARARVLDTLYNAYDDNDLRKQVFFTDIFGFHSFIGTYDFRTLGFFDGLAVDELVLTRAECYARLGNKQAAMSDLNLLLSSRYKSGTFTSLSAPTALDALRLILNERKKELCFRGLRWLDLRRLNRDINFAETLHRLVNGTTYTLEANSPRYAMPIPDNEIQLSGIQQNPR